MLKVGTSGFSFPDWRGTVYPSGLKAQDALSYYSKELGFDCVEINSTYYALVSEKSFSGMEKKTGPGFEFTVKGFRGMTHDPFDPRLGEKKPDLKKAKEDTDKFIYSLKPLMEKGKLGAVLLQFPVFFYPKEESREYILELKEKFKGIPLVIEFRSSAWAKPETIEFLRANRLGFCAVDEPKLPRLMPFINETTSGVGYMRLHGRNTNWFNATLAERYDYLYSEKELKTIIPEIRKMGSSAPKSYVFFNNCHTGSAIKNAMMLKKLLELHP